MAGRLKDFYTVWESMPELNPGKITLEWIKGYRIPLVQKPFQQQYTNTNVKYSQSEKMEEAIHLLLQQGAIEKCKAESGQYLSSFFLTKKSNGKYRFILNLKKFNSFVETIHFKFEEP